MSGSDRPAPVGAFFESPMLMVGAGDAFSDEGAPGAPRFPALIAGRCVCGHLFIPMQSFGCEVCGRFGADLRPDRLAGRGRLKGYAVVRRHSLPIPATPFTVVTVELDDGIIVRALLDPPTEPDLAIGEILVTTVVEVADAHGGPVRQVRFRRAREDD